MAFSRTFQDLYEVLPHIKKPVIAGVHGLAHGAGLDLALLCDVIVADTEAEFAITNIKAGFIGGAACSQLLPRLIGKPRTMELILTGDAVKANTL